MKSFDDLTSYELTKLYMKFVVYRDKQCNGRAAMSVKEFYKKRGLA